MELPIRSLRLFNRLFRKPLSFSAYRTVSNAAVKEEASLELLNSFNQDIKAGGAVPVFRRALLFPSRVALHDDFGTYTYAALYQAATALSEDIAAQLQGEKEYTISYMCSNDASHIVVQWAIWMTGNIAVPLTPLHPADMLKYYITDSGSNLIICLQDYEKILRPVSQELSKPLLVVHRPKDGKDELGKDQGKDEHSKEQREVGYSNIQGEDELSKFQKGHVQDDSISDVGPSNIWYGGTEAMLIYTSGTTSKPKGVVWTHNMLSTQISSLHSAWQYSAQDVVLHTLPLHHIHGQLNSLNASLAAGARIRMLPSFASHTVWARLLGTGDREDARVSVFHGVPAMYARLAADYDKLFADKKTRDYVRATLSTKMRLMCAGSAALPETLFKKWEEISGTRLLERYGMSECGMALSNPYRPLEARAVGHVGLPLPGVAVRLATAADQGLQPLLTVESPAPDTQISLDRLGLTSKKESYEGSWITSVKEHKQNKDSVFEGELLLKGPAVFTRYWNRAPKLDSPDFTEDGWFRTGDTASFADGKFRILGRTSIDIIKTGGYKVSALQVESAILEHPSVADAAVVGIEDESYGEIITTVVVLKEKCSLTLRELKAVAGKKLAPYQLPKTMLIVEEMPRNAMGKLDKKEIKKRFGQQLVFKKK